jgi:SET domain
MHDQVYTRAAHKEVEKMKVVHAERKRARDRQTVKVPVDPCRHKADAVPRYAGNSKADGNDPFGGIDSYFKGHTLHQISQASLEDAKKRRSPRRNESIPAKNRGVDDAKKKAVSSEADRSSLDEDDAKPGRSTVSITKEMVPADLLNVKRRRRVVHSDAESSDADADLVFRNGSCDPTLNDNIASSDNENGHIGVKVGTKTAESRDNANCSVDENADMHDLVTDSHKDRLLDAEPSVQTGQDPEKSSRHSRKRGANAQSRLVHKRQRRDMEHRDDPDKVQSSAVDWKAISPSTTLEVDKQSSGDEQSWERAGVSSYASPSAKPGTIDAPGVLSDNPLMKQATSPETAVEPAEQRERKEVCSVTKRERSKASKLEKRRKRELDKMTTCARTRGLDRTKWRNDKTSVVPKELEERIGRSQMEGSASAVHAGKSRRGNRQELRKLRQELQEVTRGNETMTIGLLTQRKKALMFGKSRIHGMGLYACEDIPPGDFIIEYNGEVIRRAIGDVREKTYVRQGMGDSYLFRLTADMVVDATRKGSIARFINHSCDPSVYAKIITISGEAKIVFYSKRAIRSGEELTYDYKFAFEEEDSKVACYCGAALCRKYLN